MKISPKCSDVFGDPDFMTIWQRSFGSVGSLINCEAMVPLTWMAALPIHPTRLHSLENKRKPTQLYSQWKVYHFSSFPAVPFSTGRICQFSACYPAGLRVLNSMVTGNSDVIRTSPIFLSLSFLSFVFVLLYLQTFYLLLLNNSYPFLSGFHENLVDQLLLRLVVSLLFFLFFCFPSIFIAKRKQLALISLMMFVIGCVHKLDSKIASIFCVPKLVSLGARLQPRWMKMRSEKWHPGSAILRLAQKRFFEPCVYFCEDHFHPQTMIRYARQLADAFSYTIWYRSQRMRAKACKTVEERSNLLKQTFPAFLRVSLEIVLAEPILAEPRPDSFEEKIERSHNFLDSSWRPLDALQSRLSVRNLVQSMQDHLTFYCTGINSSQKWKHES